MVASQSYRYRNPSPPRRRRWPIVLLIVLLVLVALAIGADRVARAYAQDRAASRFQQEENLARRPSVDVHGFPFLTQVLAHHFGEVSVNSHDLTVADRGHSLQLSDVTVNFHDVHVSGNFNSVRAGRADGTATITYPNLSQTLGVTLRYGGAGRIQATTTQSVDGIAVNATVAAGIAVSGDGSLEFPNATVTVAGVTLPQALVTQLESVFVPQISMASLPFGLRIGAIHPSPTGVAVDFKTATLNYG